MKAQASIEFLMLVIVTMVFVIVVYAANLNKMGEVSSTGRQQELEIGCERLSSAIDEAYYFGNGFSRNASVGGNYTIRIFNSTLICYDSGKNFISTIVPPDVRNSTDSAQFEIKTGFQKELQIENKGYIVIR